MPTIADLSVTVDDGKTSVVPGVEYFPQAAGNHFNPYTVTVTNNGPDTVHPIQPELRPWCRPDLGRDHQPRGFWQRGDS